jgi:ACT domain-containing protein
MVLLWENLMGKKVITEDEVESLSREGILTLRRGMVLTPSAREFASRKGIRIVYGGGSVPSAEDIPRDPATGNKGIDVRKIVEEVTREVIGEAGTTEQVGSESGASPVFSEDKNIASVLEQAISEEPPRAVVVSTGVNRPGIAAALTSAISECGADIQDISQTIVSDFFSMIFVVNLKTMKEGYTFKTFKEKVEAAGRSVGAETVVFHEAILKAMHRV